MKFFTPAWCSGRLSDDESEAAVAAYASHFETLRRFLPAEFVERAWNIGLHDAPVRRIVVHRGSSEVVLDLRDGHLQCGYSDLDIVFERVSIELLNVVLLRGLAEDVNTELLYEEVDVDESNRYVHRLLFWVGPQYATKPYREIEIRFKGISMQKRAQLARQFDRANCGYFELP